MWEAIVMVTMFVLGCVAMRRYMKWQGWVMPSEIVTSEANSPDDEQLMAFIKDITGRWWRAAKAGYNVAWFGDTARFYKMYGRRKVYEYEWRVDTGVVDIPDEEADVYLEHYAGNTLPPYPPEPMYNHPDNW